MAVVMAVFNARSKGNMLHLANTILKDGGYLFLAVSFDYLISIPHLLLTDP
jgi:hypothetical protein